MSLKFVPTIKGQANYRNSQIMRNFINLFTRIKVNDADYAVSGLVTSSKMI